MRPPIDRAKFERAIQELAAQVKGPADIFVTGGGTAVMEGWRPATVDLDLKAIPEPAGFFEAISDLKDRIDVNIELASPDDFIPELPGWRDRSRFIARYNQINFYHYDLYSQALAKIERNHDRDVTDVAAMLENNLINRAELLRLFVEIEPQLIRYPAIEPKVLRQAVLAICRPADSV
jgi:hypothetical protein